MRVREERVRANVHVYINLSAEIASNRQSLSVTPRQATLKAISKSFASKYLQNHSRLILIDAGAKWSASDLNNISESRHVPRSVGGYTMSYLLPVQRRGLWHIDGLHSHVMEAEYLTTVEPDHKPVHIK